MDKYRSKGQITAGIVILFPMKLNEFPCLNVAVGKIVFLYISVHFIIFSVKSELVLPFKTNCQGNFQPIKIRHFYFVMASCISDI